MAKRQNRGGRGRGAIAAAARGGAQRGSGGAVAPERAPRARQREAREPRDADSDSSREASPEAKRDPVAPAPAVDKQVCIVPNGTPKPLVTRVADAYGNVLTFQHEGGWPNPHASAAFKRNVFMALTSTPAAARAVAHTTGNVVYVSPSRNTLAHAGVAHYLLPIIMAEDPARRAAVPDRSAGRPLIAIDEYDAYARDPASLAVAHPGAKLEALATYCRHDFASCDCARKRWRSAVTVVMNDVMDHIEPALFRATLAAQQYAAVVASGSFPWYTDACENVRIEDDRVVMRSDGSGDYIACNYVGIRRGGVFATDAGNIVVECCAELGYYALLVVRVASATTVGRMVRKFGFNGNHVFSARTATGALLAVHSDGDWSRLSAMQDNDVAVVGVPTAALAIAARLMLPAAANVNANVAKAQLAQALNQEDIIAFASSEVVDALYAYGVLAATKSTLTMQRALDVTGVNTLPDYARVAANTSQTDIELTRALSRFTRVTPTNEEAFAKAQPTGLASLTIGLLAVSAAGMYFMPRSRVWSMFATGAAAACAAEVVPARQWVRDVALVARRYWRYAAAAAAVAAVAWLAPERAALSIDVAHPAVQTACTVVAAAAVARVVPRPYVFAATAVCSFGVAVHCIASAPLDDNATKMLLASGCGADGVQQQAYSVALGALLLPCVVAPLWEEAFKSLVAATGVPILVASVAFGVVEGAINPLTAISRPVQVARQSIVHYLIAQTAADIAPGYWTRVLVHATWNAGVMAVCARPLRDMLPRLPAARAAPLVAVACAVVALLLYFRRRASAAATQVVLRTSPAQRIIVASAATTAVAASLIAFLRAYAHALSSAPLLAFVLLAMLAFAPSLAMNEAAIDASLPLLPWVLEATGGMHLDTLRRYAFAGRVVRLGRLLLPTQPGVATSDTDARDTHAHAFMLIRASCAAEFIGVQRLPRTTGWASFRIRGHGVEPGNVVPLPAACRDAPSTLVLGGVRSLVVSYNGICGHALLAGVIDRHMKAQGETTDEAWLALAGLPDVMQFAADARLAAAETVVSLDAYLEHIREAGKREELIAAVTALDRRMRRNDARPPKSLKAFAKFERAILRRGPAIYVPVDERGFVPPRLIISPQPDVKAAVSPAVYAFFKSLWARTTRHWRSSATKYSGDARELALIVRRSIAAAHNLRVPGTVVLVRSDVRRMDSSWLMQAAAFTKALYIYSGFSTATATCEITLELAAIHAASKLGPMPASVTRAQMHELAYESASFERTLRLFELNEFANKVVALWRSHDYVDGAQRVAPVWPNASDMEVVLDNWFAAKVDLPALEASFRTYFKMSSGRIDTSDATTAVTLSCTSYALTEAYRDSFEHQRTVPELARSAVGDDNHVAAVVPPAVTFAQFGARLEEGWRALGFSADCSVVGIVDGSPLVPVCSHMLVPVVVEYAGSPPELLPWPTQRIGRVLARFLVVSHRIAPRHVQGHLLHVARALLTDAYHVPLLRAFASRVITLTDGVPEYVDPSRETREREFQPHMPLGCRLRQDDARVVRWMAAYYASVTRGALPEEAFIEQHDSAITYIERWQLGDWFDHPLLIAVAEADA